MNENGGRTVRIYSGLTAQIAYMAAVYRHRPALVAALDRMARRAADAARDVYKRQAHDPSLLVRYPAEGLVLDPSAVIEGRSEAYREMLDAFARRGDAVGYRTAQLLRSPVAKLPQAASLFAWRLRPPRPADDQMCIRDSKRSVRASGVVTAPCSIASSSSSMQERAR